MGMSADLFSQRENTLYSLENDNLDRWIRNHGDVNIINGEFEVIDESLKQLENINES